MSARKRKADTYDSYSHWIPTVPPPNVSSSMAYSTPSMTSAYASASASGSRNNPIELDITPPSSVVALPSLPPAKKQRKRKDPDAPAPEKRGAVFKKKCPQNILDRVERVIQQRFFMIDRTRTGNQLREEFSVLGSTGNVYTVVVDKKPSCDCPDALKGNHCKHILFIFLKVLQVTQVSGYWYQKRLLTSELEDIFNNAPPAPAAVANTHVQEAFARATGKTITPSSSQSSTGEKTNKRIPGPEDDCPICYEWSKVAKGGATCVFCRSKWVVPTPPAASSRVAGPSLTRLSERYVNLADVAGVSTVRDTSSYHHGPRKGSRYYGYQDYDEDFYGDEY